VQPTKSGAPDQPEEDGEENLRSRTDARRERKESEEALMRLAKALVDLPQRSLDKLALPESVLDVVVRARLVRDPAPKNRALRLVRIALRDGDSAAIAQALDEVHEPRRKPSAPSDLEQWRQRLLEGGEAALAEYLSAFPDADRRQIRQLVRNVSKATEASRAGAVNTLTKALRRTTG
jgi:ribosome-associated protein